MTSKCHNHRLQTYPWYREEQAQNTDSHMTERALLTHIRLASFLWDIGSVKPDQAPQNAAFDQVLHCLLTEVSFRI